jgi:S-adenosyl-L-methionine hydrolase (adenosine-forming)
VRACVALVTDFGRLDSYVAEMHAAIRRRIPTAEILDVSHQIPPFDRLSAALVCERIAQVLPLQSAIAVVVDPGVGTVRRRIFGRYNGVWLVGPDNGVLPLQRKHSRVWEIDHRKIAPSMTATTFDGREIFAPVAALLMAGMHPDLIGAPCQDWGEPILPRDAEFEKSAEGLYAQGKVIALDRYGNAITNIKPPADRRMKILSPVEFSGWMRSAYGEVSPGDPLALRGSSGRLELARREQPSGLSVGQGVEVCCSP